MESGTQLLIDLANQECVSGSLNGPALLETMRALSPQEALSTDTYEGYSAWGVALHVLYFKHLLGRELGAALPKYGYEETDFPATPAVPDGKAWDGLAAEVEAAHRAIVDSLAKSTSASLARPFVAWKMPLGKAVTWIISHDIAHNAQIRNMGLPSLREARH